MQKEIFSVKGMTCAACVLHVQKAANAALGDGRECEVSLLSSTLSVPLAEGESAETVFKKLQNALRRAGYGLEKRATDDDAHAKKEQHRVLVRLVLSFVLTALLMAVAMWHMTPLPLPFFADGQRHPVLFFSVQALLCFAVLFIERHFFKNGFAALFHRMPNMDSLVALGSAAAALYGLFAGGCIVLGTVSGDMALVHRYLHELYLESAAMILTLVSLGKFLEGRARKRAAGAVKALLSAEPREARLLLEDGERTVSVEDLKPSDLVLVAQGEKIPVDGVIFAGQGSIDEAMLTGESMPRTAGAGDEVSGGTVLVEGALRVRVTRVGEESALRRIAALLEQTAATKAQLARLADRVSGIFVPVVLCISLFTAAVWLLATRNVGLALRAAISVLVISCPCALGLATPTAITVGSGRAARFGILFKSAQALEALPTVRYLLTDKTGTLTKGEPAVTDVALLSGEKDTLSSYIASLEQGSAHPLAKPLRALSQKRVELCDFKTYTGLGLSARENDGTLLVAGQKGLFFALEEAPRPDAALLSRIEALEGEGKTVIVLSRGAQMLGLFALADEPREDSRDAVRALQARGVTVVMLTGDNEAVAARVAAEMGISTYHAGLLPEQKESLVRKYAETGRVAMVGDGINDAPALARADVGIAIGAGTGVAIESADVVLQRSSLCDAVAALDVGRATRRNIKQNLFWALAYNTVCIPVAAGALYPAFGILLSPMIACAAMSCSSLFVVLYALRLTSFSPSPQKAGKTKKHTETVCKNTNLKQKGDTDMFGKRKEMQTITLSVQGMACAHCAARVEGALTALRGVCEVKVDLAGASVTVLAKENVKIEDVKAAITDAGYQVV